MPPSASPARPSRKPPGGASVPAPGPALSLPLPSKLLLTAGVVLLADQVSKAAAVRFLSSVPTLPVVSGIFHLTLIENTGVAFGLFRGQGLAVTLATLAVLAGLGWSALRSHQPPGRGMVLGLGLILGGALGNLVDRVRLGAVIDFFDFRVWPVFNVADSCITVGALLVAIHLLKKR
ncbi:MAG: signal peptidase II [Candidatus Omnitrophica bacterium]|nr:signal peptidase II [Candidatus Omnitrophota bacterium]